MRFLWFCVKHYHANVLVTFSYHFDNLTCFAHGTFGKLAGHWKMRHFAKALADREWRSAQVWSPHSQLASIPYNTWLWHGFWWENMVPVGNHKSISIQFAGQCSWGILIAPVAILWGVRQCWRCFKSTNATMNATVSTSRVCGQTGPKSQTCSSSKCYYIVLNRFGCWRQCSNRLMIQPISVIYSDQEWCNQH